MLAVVTEEGDLQRYQLLKQYWASK